MVLYSIQRLKRRKPEWFRDDLSARLALLGQNKIRPIIAERVPLHEAAHTHTILAAPSTVGKVVLTCND